MTTLQELIKKYNLKAEYGGIDACKLNAFEITPDDYWCKYVKITKEVKVELEYNKIEPYSLLVELNVNYLLLELDGEVDFMHITEADNLEGIMKDGLRPNEEYFGDLGKGVYAIEQGDYVSEQNLLDYFAEYYESEDPKLAILTGTYTGKYYMCIDSADSDTDAHIGYIVLPYVAPELIDVEITTLEDMF